MRPAAWTGAGPSVRRDTEWDLVDRPQRHMEGRVMTELPIEPMLCASEPVEKLTSSEWSFEPKHDGYRAIVEVDHGELSIYSRSCRDVTAEFSSLSWLGRAFPDDHVVLDGEIVVCDAAGIPRFNLLQNHRRAPQVDYWIYDILAMNGSEIMAAPY